MSVISMHLKDVERTSATCVIDIKDFRQKLAETQYGESVSTEKFYINRSKFSLIILIAGDTKKSEDYISLYMVNHSDWMVRFASTVSVKNEVFMKSPISYSRGSPIYPNDQSNPNKNVYSSPFWWYKCVPHSRCIIGDLLSKDGTLTIEVRLEILTEKIPMEEEDELTKKMTKIINLKRKLDVQESEQSSVKTELSSAKTKPRDLGLDGHHDSLFRGTEGEDPDGDCAG